MPKISATQYSNFVAHHKNTQSQSWKLFKNSNLKAKNLAKFLNQNLYDDLIGLAGEPKFNASIRQIRNAAMIKIALADIEAKNPIDNLEKTILDTSLVARYLIDLAYQRAYQQSANIYGYPKDSDEKIQDMLILALGKLGANELNFSSDVDLIFCYPKDGNTDGAPNKKRKISNFEFFCKVAQRLINYLNPYLSDGFVYRVDMRLRPFGKSGPLVSSFNSIEQYYQAHGRDWERYAMIKASPIESQIEIIKKRQEKVISEFNQIIKPFIYRRYLDFSVFEALRDMKTLIDAEAKVGRSKNHVKLGFGGIRLIEFIVQSFQLVYAGREKKLQTNSLKTAIFFLAQINLISQEKVAELWRAYLFLRVVENRLQQRNDLQTHQLFSDKADLLLLAQSLGFKQTADFLMTLNLHRGNVQTYFEKLFIKKSSSEVNPFRQIWLLAIDKELLVQEFKKQGKEELLFLAEMIYQHKTQINSSAKTNKLRKDINTFMPLFFGVLQYYYNKHLNIHKNIELEKQNTIKVFNRVMKLVRRTFVSNVYLVMFNENIDLIKRICRTARVSSMLIDILMKNPFLIDQLLDRESLYKTFNQEEIIKKISGEYKGDLETEMESLRVFSHQRILSIATLDVMKSLPLKEVSNQLTYLTEGILQRVLHCAWLDVAPKFKNLDLNKEQDFCVIALGKFGGLEMSFNSDLDLVFVCKESKHLVFYIRLVQRMIHMLEITTNTGKLFNVDLRLRPNGNHGMLVYTIDNWFRYQINQAWVWEHQSLCRARIVAGDKNLAKQFKQMRAQIICQRRETNELKKQVSEMRQKMRMNLDTSTRGQFNIKHGKGGIIDIEFLVQFLLLNYAVDYPSLIKYSDNLRQIEALMAAKILSKKIGNQLIKCYFSMRAIIHQLVLENEPTLIETSQFKKEIHFVKTLWRKYLDS